MTPGQARARLKHRYGVTPEWLEATLKAQNSKCAICKRTLVKTKNHTTGPVIDHDHSSKKARELLCWHCNLGLGGFGDNIENLEAAVAYLKRHKS